MSTRLFNKWIGAAALLGAATTAQAGFIETDHFGTTPKSTIDVVPANDFLASLAGLGIETYTLGASLSTNTAGWVTYYYYGKEAGYRNDFRAGGGSLWHTTGFAPAQDLFGNPYRIGTAQVGAGVLDFSFCAYAYNEISPLLQGCVSNAQNDDKALYSYQSIALSIVGESAWLFWDDSGAGPDDNHDDMLIRAVFSATPVPEPATLTLFGLGLLGIGLVRRRK
ncbi:MAG TPA: PEP-CTERM sorting domain-containing protein [Steroidobacteraceae bacterium]|nr:PEP-CTERM sorting domain-containing protein [Steroidobacteraceae bacterium]